MKNTRQWIALCCCLLTSSSLSFASTFIQTNEEDFIRQAKLLCAFEVGQTKSILVQDQVFTQANIKAIHCPKGNIEAKALLRWPGGVKTFVNPHGNEESLTTRVPGLPQLKKGQYALAALKAEIIGEQKIYFLDQWRHIQFLKKNKNAEFILIDQSENPQFFNLHRKSSRSPRSLKKQISLKDFSQKVEKILGQR